MHLKITNCISLELFILAINLNVMLSSNVFTTMVLYSDVISYCSESMKFLF